MLHPGILFMRVIAPLPLSWLRGLGSFLGRVLYWLAAPRRKVVLTNLALCFPGKSVAEREQLARQSFVFFAQSFLDRSWLWHGEPEVLRQRLRMTGAVSELEGSAPTVIFAPHFYGLDAGATALSLQVDRHYTTIYTPQPNPAIDAWIRDSRRRFGHVRLFYRADGLKPIVAALRSGEVLYLLPDMNFGPQESIFVPFYGVPAATVPSLSRLARLGRAKVVPITTRMTSTGYEVQVHPAWTDFPTQDLEADTALMNLRLQDYIDTMPAQYYWVHKRFKTRPPGEPAVY
jgi:KDO2-lipid IV(A) lauroyltransferase